MTRKTTREEKAKYWKFQIDNMLRYEMGSNQSKLLKAMVEEYGWSPSRSSFSSRLAKGSLTLIEFSEILEYCNKKLPKIFDENL